ncbi:MAG TPA: DUF362 domain-containing protein [Candidatus Hydrogenedentes bacterium]|nr:DUF362 domain-containing protein [Candidatus Hydrogenedentota bacterium]HPG66014.1 DUF362 domain-containing protein [Candidatus Hydrogenedentota bacterium]
MFDKISRRRFLGHVGRVSAVAGAALAGSGCPTPVIPPNAPVTHRSRVVAVRGRDLVTMTRETLEAFGGIESVVNPGETVFIKPNFGAIGMVQYNPIRDGDCAKPEIVLTVAEECLKAGAAEVIIGEGGQSNVWDWKDVETLDGATNVADEAARLTHRYPGKVSLVCLNSQSPTYTPIPSPFTTLGEIYISSLLLEADRIISIPVIKSHRWTQVTASLKNFVGVTPAPRYGMGLMWRFLLHNAGIEQCFLDVVRAVQPDFAIADCSICCEGNGPHVMPGWWGTTVDMRDRLGDWLLLAGTDLAAVDATAARVISHDPDAVDHLRMAYEQGFGQIQEALIDLDGARLDELRVPWQPAEHTEGFSEVLLPGAMLVL